MRSHKKLITAGLSSIVFAALLGSQGLDFLLVPLAHAQGAPTSDMMSAIFEIFSVILSFMQFIVVMLLHMMELLLDPEVFLEAFEGAGPGATNPLREIWKISRDITNVLLAVVLVFGAVWAIITANKDFIIEYAVKFILAIILVNFSWFFPRVIIDVANVLTATIYTVPVSVLPMSAVDDPAGSPPSRCVYRQDNKTKRCDIWGDVTFLPSDATALKGSGFECIIGDLVCFKKEPFDSNANTPQAILLGLVINFGRIADIGKVPISTSGLTSGGAPITTAATRSMLANVMGVFFRVFLMIALLFPLLAMMAAFVIRIPILWLTIAFMPFMFVGFVMGDKIPKLNPMMIWHEFLKAAFLPFFVGIPLAAGFILANIGATMAIPPGLGYATTPVKLLFVNVNTLWDLLWMIMTIGILWVGTFKMLNNMGEIYASVANTVSGWGKAIGGLAIKAPLSVPFIPVPGKGNVSPLAIAAGLSPHRLSSQLSSAAIKQVDDLGLGLGGKTGEEIAEAIGNHTDKINIATNLKQHYEFIMNNPTDSAGIQTRLAAIGTELQKVGGPANPDAHTAAEVLEKLKTDASLSAVNLGVLDESVIEQNIRNATP
jgi:hypothetical protein